MAGLKGFLYDDAGVAIEGATVDLLDRNTTTPVRQTTTTDSGGSWELEDANATNSKADVRITNGASVRWIKFDDVRSLGDTPHNDNVVIVMGSSDDVGMYFDGSIWTFDADYGNAGSCTEIRFSAAPINVLNDIIHLASSGAPVDRATTAGTNCINIFNGTAPSGTLTNGATFYCASGEMNVMDAAGNATLLSPHDPETNEWIFRSKTPDGRTLKVNMERLVKKLEEHFGWGFVEEFFESDQ